LVAHHKRLQLKNKTSVKEGRIRRVLDWIDDQEGDTFTFRNLHLAVRLSKAKAKEDWKPIVDLLEENGYIRQVKPKGQTTGRPSLEYEVNPETKVCEQNTQNTQNYHKSA
jgi:hypothetical protein